MNLASYYFSWCFESNSWALTNPGLLVLSIDIDETVKLDFFVSEDSQVVNGINSTSFSQRRTRALPSGCSLDSMVLLASAELETTCINGSLKMFFVVLTTEETLCVFSFIQESSS